MIEDMSGEQLSGEEQVETPVVDVVGQLGLLEGSDVAAHAANSTESPEVGNSEHIEISAARARLAAAQAAAAAALAERNAVNAAYAAARDRLMAAQGALYTAESRKKDAEIALERALAEFGAAAGPAQAGGSR